MVNSDGWKKDKAYLPKTMKLWSKTLGHAIIPSIYKGKKHMEQTVRVKMTVNLERTFEDLMDGHNPTGCVFKNRSKVKQDEARDNAKKASAATQTYEDRLRLTKVDTVAPPVGLPKVTLAINTFTAEVWTYHGEDCLLYKYLLEWVEELKGLELMNE